MKRILNGAVIEAVARQPSILLMDNLDHICCNPDTLEEDINGEAPLSSRSAEYLVDMLHAARRGGATITLIGISRNQSALNPVLLNVKGGNQLFGKIVKLSPPNLVSPSLCQVTLTISCTVIACYKYRDITIIGW